MNNRDKFYAHLDACSQCRDHPMALCPLGGPMLRAAALQPLEVSRND